MAPLKKGRQRLDYGMKGSVRCPIHLRSDSGNRIAVLDSILRVPCEFMAGARAPAVRIARKEIPRSDK